MNTHIDPSATRRSIALHRESTIEMISASCSQDAVVTSGDVQSTPAPEVSLPSEGRGYSNESHQQPPDPNVSPVSKTSRVRKLTHEHLYRENDTSGKDYVYSTYFESAATSLDPLPLAPAPAGGGATAATIGRVRVAQMVMAHYPQPPTATPAPKVRRRSTPGRMSPTRPHPYKSSSHPVKPRPSILLTAADYSHSTGYPLRKDPLALPSSYPSQQEQMKYESGILPSNPNTLHSQASWEAFMTLQRLGHRLKEVQHQQMKPRLQLQRSFSESDAIQNEYNTIHGPSPMDISKSIHVSRGASPSPITIAADTTEVASSLNIPMDVTSTDATPMGRTVRTSRAVSPSPMTAAAASTVVASSSVRIAEQQEQNVPHTPSVSCTPPGFLATLHIPKTMLGEDEAQEQGNLPQQQQRQQQQQQLLLLQQEQINTPSDETAGLMDQDRYSHGSAVHSGTNEMDDVASEMGPEDHARELERARAETKLARQQYDEAQTNLRIAQEQEQAIEYEREMQQSRRRDRISLQKQPLQIPSSPLGAAASRPPTVPLPSTIPLFSASSSRGSSITSFVGDSDLSQGYLAILKQRPQVYPPPESLIQYYQQQNQLTPQGNGKGRSERTPLTPIREVQAKTLTVDKGKGPKVVPPEDDSPLVDSRFNRQLSSVGSTSLPHARTSAQVPDRKYLVNQGQVPPVQTRPYQNHPRGRAHHMDLNATIVIPSSVGSASDRHTEEEFFSDHSPKRTSTSIPSRDRKHGQNFPNRHRPPHGDHHRSYRGHVPSKSPRIKKQSSSPSPPSLSPPPSPVYDHSLPSSGTYPSPSASRILPPPTLQRNQTEPQREPPPSLRRNRTDPPRAHALGNRPATRVATTSSGPQHHYYRPRQPHQDAEPSGRHHRQQHQYHQIRNPILDQLFTQLLGQGGSSSTTGLNANHGGSAIQDDGRRPPFLYYHHVDSSNHHHHYYPQPTNKPPPKTPSNDRSFVMEDEMKGSSDGGSDDCSEDWDDAETLSNIEEDESNPGADQSSIEMVAEEGGEEEEEEEEEDVEEEEEEDVQGTSTRTRRKSWATRSQPKLKSPTF